MDSLTNANLLSRFVGLADCHSRAKSGTTTTVVCTKLEHEYPDDDLVGWYICFLSGENKGLDRLITASDKQTGTLTFNAVPVAVSDYTEMSIVEDGYIRYQEEAKNLITDDLRNIGKNIDLFLTPVQLKELHLTKTLDLICLDRFVDGVATDLYYSRHLHYSDVYDQKLLTLKADYDENENGVIDDDEELSVATPKYGILKR